MTDDRTGVLLEDINGKLDGLIEVVSSMNDRLINVEETITVIPEMAADIKTIKAAQIEQGKDIQRHETYLVAQGMPARA